MTRDLQYSQPPTEDDGRRPYRSPEMDRGVSRSWQYKVIDVTPAEERGGKGVRSMGPKVHLIRLPGLVPESETSGRTTSQAPPTHTRVVQVERSATVLLNDLIRDPRPPPPRTQSGVDRHTGPPWGRGRRG